MRITNDSAGANSFGQYLVFQSISHHLYWPMAFIIISDKYSYMMPQTAVFTFIGSALSE
jgi:hypothetical protein